MKASRVLSLVAGLLLGASQGAFADVTFTVSDTPGHWFDAGPAWDLDGGRSLAVIAPGQTVHFTQTVGPKAMESYHTITNLVWPTAANGPVGPMGIEDAANKDDHEVTLTTPGLYVWVCKLHPYMLGAVIVDNTNTHSTSASDPSNIFQGASFDLGDQNGSLTMLGADALALVQGTPGKVTFKDTDDVAARLLRAFFIVTNPSNWKDYRKANLPSPHNVYQPVYPNVPVHANNGPVSVDLKTYLLGKNYDGKVIEAQHKPSQNGIGEVWVDTAYELTQKKNGPPNNEEWFPGTMTVVSATTWDVKRKIALPEQKMNNGHNFWTSHDQEQIYQTEWHGNSLYVINRHDGKLIQEIDLVNGSEVQDPKFNGKKCHDPAHVMTRVDTQQVHVGCNGDDSVLEFDRDPNTGRLSINRFIPMSVNPGVDKQTQPHAHWMGFDGWSMITPNSNTSDSTLFNFPGNEIIRKEHTGTLPIATGMMPDSSINYVSNYLGDTISVMCGHYPPVSGPYAGCASGTHHKDINLLKGYDPVAGTNDSSIPGGVTKGPYGGFSVQTPVSPDGKFVIQGNTFSGTITIIRTAKDNNDPDTHDEIVRSIPCDPGCHGVNFGAKKGGGYYAYVTSKFANRVIVLDYDPNNDGKADDAVIAGAVVLANDNVPKDDQITGNRGQGGQGVLAVPNVYNGWVQELPVRYKAQLTREQRNPIGPLPGRNPHDK